MTEIMFKKFLEHLVKRGYGLIAPTINEHGQAEIDQIMVDDFNSQALKQAPLYSFKKFFIPSEENLFMVSRGQARSVSGVKPIAMIGLSVFDFLAINLWRQVFEKDLYWQERFKQMLLIGFGPTSIDKEHFDLWEEKYEEDVLEHIQFDLFILQKDSQWKIFTGSRLGQNLLSDLGHKDYQHIQFTGVLREEGVLPWVKEVRNKLFQMKSIDKLWQDLGQKCIACGRCSIVCPTCFCFDINDQVINEHGQVIRKRSWSNCFYSNFSQTASHNFLPSIADKIYFWYYHKFVRIPDEFSIPGCIGCGRCYRVCPAKININEVLKSIRNNND